jgi:hypothetical protein
MKHFRCSLFLLRHFDALSVGGLRGVRGTRIPADPTRIPKAEVSLVSGDELLRELEAERRQLWRETAPKNSLPDSQPMSKSEFFHNEKRSQKEQPKHLSKEGFRHKDELRHKNEFVHKNDFFQKNEFRQKNESFQKNELVHKGKKDKTTQSIKSDSRKASKEDKSRRYEDHDEEENKLVVTSDNQFQLLNQIICPLLEVPYEEQLEMKTKKHKNILSRLDRLTPQSKMAHSGRIIPSDTLTEYRTKDEFGIQKVIEKQ